VKYKFEFRLPAEQELHEFISPGPLPVHKVEKGPGIERRPRPPVGYAVSLEYYHITFLEIGHYYSFIPNPDKPEPKKPFFPLRR
jgi:hypothetical protein